MHHFTANCITLEDCRQLKTTLTHIGQEPHWARSSKNLVHYELNYFSFSTEININERCWHVQNSFLIYCPHWSLCCRWFGVFCQTATVPPDVAGLVGAVLVSSGLSRNQELHLTDIADATRSPMATLWPCFYHCLQSLPIIELAQTFDI